MIGRWLNRSVQVWRAAAVGDAAGGQAVTRASVGEVRVKVDQPVHAERRTAEAAESWQDFIVYAAPGADIRRGDELRGGGQVLRVDGAFTPSTPRYLRLDCVLLQSEGDQVG